MAKRKTAVGKFIADQPKWSKGILSTAALVGGGYLVYKGIKLIGAKADPTQKALETESKNYSKSQQLTYPVSNYAGFADQIFAAFQNTYNIFDVVDEQDIFDVYAKMKNDLDVNQLTKAFGKRRVPTAVPFVGLALPDVDLYTWINEALTATEKNKLNASLTAKGIKYQY